MRNRWDSGWAFPWVLLFLVLCLLANDAQKALAVDSAQQSGVQDEVADNRESWHSDQPEPLQYVPDQQQKDRAVALAHYGTGRHLLNSSQALRAIPHFERALRYDPASGASAEMVLALTINAKRYREAIDYALLAEHYGKIKASDLRNLAKQAADSGQHAEAAALLDKMLAMDDDSVTPLLRVMMHIDHAESCAASGRHHDAIDSLKHALDVYAQPGDFGVKPVMIQLLIAEPYQLWKQLGDSYLEIGSYDAALDAFRQSDQLHPQPNFLAYIQAVLAFEQDKPEVAMRGMLEYLEQYTDDQARQDRPYVILKDCLAKLDRADDLRELLSGLQSKRADDPYLLLALARHALEAERLEQAEAYLDEIVERKLFADPSLNASYRQFRAQILKQRGDADGLLDLIQERLAHGDLPLFEIQSVVADDPALCNKLITKVRKQFDTKTPSNELLRLVVRVVDMTLSDLNADDSESETESDSETVPELERAAIALMNLTVRKIAAGYFDKLAESERMNVMQALAGFGALLGSHQREAAAESALRTGLKYTSEYAPDYRELFAQMLASALTYQGRTDEAIQLLEGFMPSSDFAMNAMKDQTDEETEPMKREKPKVTPIRILAGLCNVYLLAGRVDDACRIAVLMKQQYGNVYGSPAVRDELRIARTMLAASLFERGEQARAVELLEQVLDEFPNDAGALNDLGYYWSESGENLPRALEMTRRAVDAEPDNAAFRDSFGWVLFRLGRFEEAVVQLERAAVDHDVEIVEHLGDVYHAMHRPVDAGKAYRRLLQSLSEMTDKKRLGLKISSNPDYYDEMKLRIEQKLQRYEPSPD